MKGYNGHVEDIDIWLIRGAYVINDIKIWETDSSSYSKDSFPFFKANAIDLSLEWKSLFRGRIVGKVQMTNPVINFTQKPVDTSNIKSDTADFRELVRNIMPLTINYFKIKNGEIHYIDRYTSPKVDLLMNRIFSTATNLSNVSNKDTLLPSHIHADGKAYDGLFRLDINLDPLNKIPTFDFNAELTDLNLVKVNDFLKAYAYMDVSAGTFSIYTEFAAKNGKFSGYIKPLIKEIKIDPWSPGESLKRSLWETVVSGVAFVLTNHRTDEIGTKVEMDGKFNNPKIGIVNSIKYLIVNAYIQALKPTIDNTININNAGNKGTEKLSLMKKIFGKKDSPPK